MAEIDLTWANPTEAQNVALDIAMKQKPRDLTEFQAAEFICLADNSLWYVQAKSWAKSPPKIGSPSIIWQRACQIIIDIVDLGYDEAQKMWWPMATLGNPNEIIAKTILLMDFGHMLKQYRRCSLDIVSRGFEVFLDIVLGKGWEKRFKQFLDEKAKEAAPRQPKIVPCINPLCDMQVDRNKRRSGACSQAHMRYYCSQCECWHHWGTKIASEHQEFYVCNWSKEVSQRVRRSLGLQQGSKGNSL